MTPSTCPSTAGDPGAGQCLFSDLRPATVQALWDEGVTLRRRDQATNGRWHSRDKRSRQLYSDKCFFYREIAGKADALGSLDLGIAAVQKRWEEAQKEGRKGGGWTVLLKKLQVEQVDKSDYKNKLTELLKSMELL